MKTLARRAAEILWTSDLTIPRLTVALASMTWGLILLTMGPQFERPSYVHMRDLAPQWTWGAAFAVCGIYQFARAFIGVPITRGTFAAVVAGVIAFLWLFVCVMVAGSLDPPPGLLAGNVGITSLACLILVRSVVQRD